MPLKRSKSRDWKKISISSLQHPTSDSRRARRFVWKQFLDQGGEFKYGEG